MNISKNIKQYLSSKTLGLVVSETLGNYCTPSRVQYLYSKDNKMFFDTRNNYVSILIPHQKYSRSSSQ